MVVMTQLLIGFFALMKALLAVVGHLICSEPVSDEFAGSVPQTKFPCKDLFLKDNFLIPHFPFSACAAGGGKNCRPRLRDSKMTFESRYLEFSAGMTSSTLMSKLAAPVIRGEVLDISFMMGFTDFRAVQGLPQGRPGVAGCSCRRSNGSGS